MIGARTQAITVMMSAWRIAAESNVHHMPIRSLMRMLQAPKAEATKRRASMVHDHRCGDHHRNDSGKQLMWAEELVWHMIENRHQDEEQKNAQEHRLLEISQTADDFTNRIGVRLVLLDRRLEEPVNEHDHEDREHQATR